MQLPQSILSVIERLENNGYDAYVVGGCVRDFLLKTAPSDWDVCTSALPQTVCELFDDHTCILTGIQHGTVTVMFEQNPVEITTYRREDGYGDHRHPDQVTFVSSIEDDLARRDFTVNAMAYHPVRGLVDPFGGKDDLEKGILRCVGTTTQRFEEDALRILRCLRFAACYDFKVEEQTAQAIRSQVGGLDFVAAERIHVELDRLLTGKAVRKVLFRFRSVLFHIIPELALTDGFEQHSRYHRWDVFEHTVESVASARCDRTVRLALLLHDIGKPHCFSMDEHNQGHFFGHHKQGEEIATAVLRRLKYDRQTTERVALLIRYHDTVILPQESVVKRWLNRLGEGLLRQLLFVKEGDCLGHDASLHKERLQELATLHAIIDRVIEEGQCFSLKDLAINGKDVLRLGIPEGTAVGEALQWALNAVVEGVLQNDYDILMEALSKRT